MPPPAPQKVPPSAQPPIHPSLTPHELSWLAGYFTAMPSHDASTSSAWDTLTRAFNTRYAKAVHRECLMLACLSLAKDSEPQRAVRPFDTGDATPGRQRMVAVVVFTKQQRKEEARLWEEEVVKRGEEEVEEREEEEVEEREEVVADPVATWGKRRGAPWTRGEDEWLRGNVKRYVRGDGTKDWKALMKAFADGTGREKSYFAVETRVRRLLRGKR